MSTSPSSLPGCMQLLTKQWNHMPTLRLVLRPRLQSRRGRLVPHSIHAVQAPKLTRERVNKTPGVPIWTTLTSILRMKKTDFQMLRELFVIRLPPPFYRLSYLTGCFEDRASRSSHSPMGFSSPASQPPPPRRACTCAYLYDRFTRCCRVAQRQQELLRGEQTNGHWRGCCLGLRTRTQLPLF